MLNFRSSFLFFPVGLSWTPPQPGDKTPSGSQVESQFRLTWTLSPAWVLRFLQNFCFPPPPCQGRPTKGWDDNPSDSKRKPIKGSFLGFNLIIAQRTKPSFSNDSANPTMTNPPVLWKLAPNLPPITRAQEKATGQKEILNAQPPVASSPLEGLYLVSKRLMS